MTEINNTAYIDDREKPDTQILASIVFDKMEVTRLDVGDVLMRGVVFEMKAPADFVSSVFDDRLFQQIKSMTEYYPHSFILVHGTFFETQLIYDSRSRVHNFPGIVASCIARGITPLFTGSLDASLDIISLISSKCTDGKIRDRPIKKTNIKDVQLSIICSLPGVSDTRAKNLLEHFGTIEKILLATEKELTEVNDVGPKTASKIIKICKVKYNNEKIKSTNKGNH